jgi:hypothetical protein
VKTVVPQKCCRKDQTEPERAPKLSGSKFIKQNGSNSAYLSPKAEPQEQWGPYYIPFRASYRNGKEVHFVLFIIICHFIGHSNLCGEVTLLWSQGKIPQLWFFFILLYHALTLIIIYFLPSTSLPSCSNIYFTLVSSVK